MASVDKDALNGVGRTTDVHAGGQSTTALFKGEFVFGADAFPAFALGSAMKGQSIDAAYGRAFNDGRGVVGEGGDTGPGLIGIAGSVIARADKTIPRDLQQGPQLGRGFRFGVVGFGADPAARGERGGDAAGVLGYAERSVGVWGRSRAMPGVFGSSSAHAGLYGWSQSVAVTGDGSAGHIGVEGVGNSFGVYGHVNYAAPNADGAGVFGAAAADLTDLDKFTGRAGVFVGPVDVIGKLTCTGDLVVWGTKSAAARHSDGSHRLLYCVESPESQFEDFGEAKLVKGRAEVRLDRDFAAVADTRKYHVFLSPYGECAGLFVAKRTRVGFAVREQGNGKSAISFSYRIVAKRKNGTAGRFQKVAVPRKPKIPVSLLPPEMEPGPTQSALKLADKGERSKR